MRTYSGRGPGVRDRGNADGFTLIELLTVLVIVGVLVSVAAPATGHFLDNLNFRRQTHKIMATLRYARLVSVSKGQEVHVKVDPDNETILQLSGAVEEKKECGLTENDYLTIEPEEIIFFPEGVATPATLTFTKGDRTREIRLELLTGLPSIS